MRGVLRFNGTVNSTIVGNVMNGITATSIITLVGSPANVISSNVINGTATNGILLDSASTGIGGLDSNQIGDSSLGTVTRLITDNGSTPSAHRLGASLTGGCTTGSTSFATCPNTLNWASGGFTQTPRFVTCQGINPSDPRAGWAVTTVTPTQVTVQTVTNGSVAVSFGAIQCVGSN